MGNTTRAPFGIQYGLLVKKKRGVLSFHLPRDVIVFLGANLFLIGRCLLPEVVNQNPIGSCLLPRVTNQNLIAGCL